MLHQRLNNGVYKVDAQFLLNTPPKVIEPARQDSVL